MLARKSQPSSLCAVPKMIVQSSSAARIYQKVMSQQCAIVAGYVAESRKSNAIAKYNKLRGGELKESTVTTWKARTPKIVTTTPNCVREGQ